mmetsp:Transcript_56729/g.85760  ORF Transcript_56729/g.85760 Transcript_56729/m.85760 type:complete len:205 (+) Transcript_56729:1176-1790(+)
MNLRFFVRFDNHGWHSLAIDGRVLHGEQMHHRIRTMLMQGRCHLRFNVRSTPTAGEGGGVVGNLIRVGIQTCLEYRARTFVQAGFDGRFFDGCRDGFGDIVRWDFDAAVEGVFPFVIKVLDVSHVGRSGPFLVEDDCVDWIVSRKWLARCVFPWPAWSHDYDFVGGSCSLFVIFVLHFIHRVIWKLVFRWIVIIWIGLVLVWIG